MITVLLPGDPSRAELDAVQAKLEAIRTDRNAVASASVCHDELTARCQREARRLLNASDAATRIGYLAQPGNPPALISRNEDPGDIVALVTTLLGEQVVAKRLFELAIGDQEYAPGLPEAERATRIAELDESLHRLLIDEEIECCRLERDGATYVMRRPLGKLDVDAIVEAWDRVATFSAASPSL